MTWNYTFDLNEVSGPRAFKAAPEGFYKVTIKSTEPVLNKEGQFRGMISFKCQITEGEYQGSQVDKGIILPNAVKGDNRFVWRGIFESIGYSAAQLNAGSMVVQDPNETFAGRTAFVYYKPKHGDGTYKDLMFMAQHVWEARKLSAKTKANAQGSALGSTGTSYSSPTPVSVPTRISPTPSIQAATPPAGYAKVNTQDILGSLKPQA
jgi:hypothetical protein